MTSDHEEWAEKSLNTLKELLTMDGKIIKNLAIELNRSTPHFHIRKIAEITKLDHSQSLQNIMALSAIVHFYVSHNSGFEKELKTTLNPAQDKLRLFISTLNEKGKNGLQIMFLANNQYISEPRALHATNDELIFKLVYDDNGKSIGMFPLVKLELSTDPNLRNESSESYLFPVHVLKNLSDVFRNSYDNNITQIKKYSNKLEGEIIIFDDE